MKKTGAICDVCKNYVSDSGQTHELRHVCGDNIDVFDVCERCFTKMKQQPFDKAEWLYEMRNLMSENKISHAEISEQFEKGDRLHFVSTVASVLTNNGAKSKSYNMDRVEQAIRELADSRRKA